MTQINFKQIFFIFPLLDKCLYGKHLYLGTLKGYVQNRYNITLSVTVTKTGCTGKNWEKRLLNSSKLMTEIYVLFFWLTPSNSNSILLAEFPFMRPFQCPVYLGCIIIQSTSIPLAYHLFIILTLKILPNSIFSIFLFCPLWRPIIILHLVYSLANITLSIGYNSQSLPFWECERVLTSNLEISTNKENI